MIQKNIWICIIMNYENLLNLIKIWIFALNLQNKLIFLIDIGTAVEKLIEQLDVIDRSYFAKDRDK